jgi:hypothetical protein
MDSTNADEAPQEAAPANPPKDRTEGMNRRQRRRHEAEERRAVGDLKKARSGHKRKAK